MDRITNAHIKERREIRAVQFGEGNFLRGFVDAAFCAANRKGITDIGVAVLKPILMGSLNTLKEQDGMYTVLLRGKQGGRVLEIASVVDCVQECLDLYDERDHGRYMKLAASPALRFVVSNTTEAGIVFDKKDRFDLSPPDTFPGKLTKFLYERYTVFGGAKDKGLVMLPVELIENNGGKLLECVLEFCRLWELPEGFIKWVKNSNVFCNTLVDRIITGYPKDKAEKLWEHFGYEDRAIVTGEPFALWVIECGDPDALRNELPLDKAWCSVVFTKDLKPYRDRKVSVLNGAHTGTALAAFLTGLSTVGQCMEDRVMRTFIERLIYDEVVPVLPLPEDEVKAYAASVFERFENPFIHHELLSISLNSVSKWKTRNLPSLLSYCDKFNKLPDYLTFSFAALLSFYGEGKLNAATGEMDCLRKSDNAPYTVRDDREVLEFFASASSDGDYVRLVSKNTALWGMDLSGLTGFCQKVSDYMSLIKSCGMSAAIRRLLSGGAL